LNEVDPLLFYKPYYLETGKGGNKAYVLLRDALIESGKIAIARVVIRAREHLASIQQTQARPKSGKAAKKTQTARRKKAA
jgi:non-homologous end joining protein Ku